MVRVLRMRLLRRRIDFSMCCLSILCVLYSVSVSPPLMYYISPCFALGLGVWLLFEFHLPGICQTVCVEKCYCYVYVQYIDSNK
jgi:hypothetical protein